LFFTDFDPIIERDYRNLSGTGISKLIAFMSDECGRSVKLCEDPSIDRFFP